MIPCNPCVCCNGPGAYYSNGRGGYVCWNHLYPDEQTSALTIERIGELEAHCREADAGKAEAEAVVLGLEGTVERLSRKLKEVKSERDKLESRLCDAHDIVPTATCELCDKLERERDALRDALRAVYEAHRHLFISWHWGRDHCEYMPCDCDACSEAIRLMGAGTK